MLSVKSLFLRTNLIFLLYLSVKRSYLRTSSIVFLLLSVKWAVLRTNLVILMCTSVKSVVLRTCWTMLQNQQADSHDGHADNDSGYGDMVFSVFLRRRQQFVQRDVDHDARHSR